MKSNNTGISLSEGEGQGEVLIPLELINLQGDGFHLLVEVVVYGQNFQAVLDTGASKSAFDKEIIESLAFNDIIHLPNQHAVGLGTTTMERYVANFSELKIGDFLIKNYEAPVFDLSAVKYAYEQLNLPPVIGVIGGDILMDYQAKIDYESLTLVLKAVN
ncbi:retropepsin-like aspartic protease [Pedobacter glucosidilyticus]|uniref:retropepsin-like aspartic protease n=1 Tax=Pedobacter glucosidilyticus TaxID=1122941 RepID=UPI000420C63D|nr:retropepsin-like aspartic protease [Pedobacter glucosidilyticus]